jgi:hypothetical protein
MVGEEMYSIVAETNSRLPIIFLFVGVSFMVFGCSQKEKLERKYTIENCFGNWNAHSVIVTNSHDEHERIEFSVPRYGQINCQINPDSSFTLNVGIFKDVTLTDDQMWLSVQRVLVHNGYKLFISGTYEYKDSIADFYSYNRDKHFRSVFYTYDDDFYLSYIDGKQNTWEIQFEEN